MKKIALISSAIIGCGGGGVGKTLVSVVTDGIFIFPIRKKQFSCQFGMNG
jgi:hypothetical protein